MTGEPNWTDKISAGAAVFSAIFAFVSTVALIVIAIAANDLQQEIKQLTFPEPDPQFSIPEEISLPDGSSMGAFYENQGAADLFASGFSAQDIVVESIAIEEVIFPDSEQFMIPAGSNGIELQWNEEDSFVIEPDDKGQISLAIPLLIAANFGKFDYSSPMSESLPLEIDITFQIDWFEAQTMRPHSTTVNSTVLVD